MAITSNIKEEKNIKKIINMQISMGEIQFSHNNELICINFINFFVRPCYPLLPITFLCEKIVLNLEKILNFAYFMQILC